MMLLPRRSLFRLAALLLCVLPALALADKFTIGKFGGVEDSPGEPDQFIAAEFANQLKKASASSIQDGRFYVRQKFEDPFDDEMTYYDLYEGKATPAKAKLGRFSTENVPYSQLLMAKFFLNQGASGDDDIEKVYFDGKFVYVEGDDPIYMYYNGTMIQLKSSTEKEVSIDITTQPSGAELYVNGELKGTTPLKFSVFSSKSVVVKVQKKGFYPEVRIYKPKVGSVLQDGILLTARKDLDDPVNPLRLKLLELQKKNDTQGLVALRASAAKKSSEYAVESRVLIDQIKASFPPNPGQKPDESSEDYAQRTKEWQTALSSEETQLNTNAKLYDDNLKSLVEDIDKSLEGQYFSLRWSYIPPADISLGAFSSKDFEVSVASTVPEGNVTWKGKLVFGSFNKQKILDDKDKLQAVVKTWNIPSTAGKYPAGYDIAFFLDQEPLRISGKSSAPAIAPADATVASKASAFSARLTKLSPAERSSWDAKDKESTLALLKDFSEPAPVVAAIPAPIPAPTPALPEVDSSSTEEENAYADHEDEDEGSVSSDERDAAAEEAAADVEERFGNQDEYLRWAAWGLTAVAVGTLGWGIYQHSKYNEAKNQVSKWEYWRGQTIDEFEGACEKAGNPPDCEQILIGHSEQTTTGTLYYIDGNLAANKKTMDSYASARNLSWYITAGSVVGATLLFTW